MMDVSTVAAAFAGAQAGQVQGAVAVKMMKMNADHAASIVQMLEAGQQNLERIVSEGVGQNLDISV